MSELHLTCLCVHTHAFNAYLNIKCQKGARCEKPCFSHFSEKMSLDVSCDSTCAFSWWIHPLDVFYLYFPKGYMWEVAEEIQTLALGTLRGLCSSRIHPGLLCHSPSAEKQYVPWCWIWNTCCTISQSYVHGQSCDWVISAYVCVCAGFWWTVMCFLI